MLAYGVGYGTATLSCVLPVFLVAVGASASASNNDRIAGIVGFTLGMGSVITLVSLAAGLFEGVAQRIRGASRVVTPLSGLLLVAAGAYIVHRELPLAAITLNRREPSANVTLELTAVGVIASVAVGIVASRVVGGGDARLATRIRGTAWVDRRRVGGRVYWRDREGVEFAEIARLVPLDGRRVLDVGCGTGRLTVPVAERAARVYAFDPDADAVSQAHGSLPAGVRRRVSFAAHGAEALDVPRRRFDVALCGWSL